MSRYGLNIFVNLVCVKGGIEIPGGKDEIFNKGAETIAWPSGKKNWLLLQFHMEQRF